MIRCFGATFDIVGPDGSREVAAADFFLDLYTTALEPGEILRSVLIPPLPQVAVTGFEEISRRHGDFAMAGAAVRLVSGARKIEEACICFPSVGVTPVRAFAAERTLSGMTLDTDAICAARPLCLKISIRLTIRPCRLPRACIWRGRCSDASCTGWVGN